MKWSLTILMLLLFFVGQSKASGGKNFMVNCCYVQVDHNLYQSPELQANISEDQDSNDVEGCASYAILFEPVIRPVVTSVVIRNNVIPTQFRVQINTLLVDLPPPSVS